MASDRPYPPMPKTQGYEPDCDYPEWVQKLLRDYVDADRAQQAEAVTPAMIAAGAAAAREYFERTGGNDPAVIYRAMRAATRQAAQVPVAAREALMVAKGALQQLQPCVEPSCGQEQREWVDAALRKIDAALALHPSAAPATPTRAKSRMSDQCGRCGMSLAAHGRAYDTCPNLCGTFLAPHNCPDSQISLLFIWLPSLT